jgi:phage gp36-like protein
MGNYATVADVKSRFTDDVEVAHLTLDEETATPDEDVINDYIAGAEGEMNSYIGKRYLIPYNTALDSGVAAILKTTCVDLVVYAMAKRNGPVSGPLREGRDDAIDWLAKVAANEIVLPSTETPPSTTSDDPVFESGTAGTGDTSSRVFSRATQENL